MTIRANGEQVPPLVVPNVSFSAGSSSITVSWDSVSGADTYEVFGKMLAGCYPSYRTSLAITSNTSWINNDVILGFEYDHYINPCNAAGCINPDAIIGSSPIYSAPCHVNCTSHSQCTYWYDTISCISTLGIDCVGEPYSCRNQQGGCMGGICQYVTVGNYAGVFYGESSPVNSCYLTLDYLNGCTPCWPWGYQCYKYDCSGGGLVQGDLLCSCVGNCGSYTTNHCFPDPAYGSGYSCSESCTY